MSDTNKSYEELEQFTQKVLQKMKEDKVPTTPEYYKIYFQKTLLEEQNCEFRKYVATINIKEEKEEAEKILDYEAKIDAISKLNKHILKNIHSTYKKNSYLVKFIKVSQKQSQSLATPQAINLFFKKLTSTIEHIHKSMQKDMEVIKELYSRTVAVLKQLEAGKIFDTKFKVYKKEYFLSKLKKELDNVKKYHFQSYLMVIRLNKETIEKLQNPINIEKANRFFSNILQNKFRKDDIIGYLDSGIFGVIFSNLNPTEVQKVALKFSALLSSASMLVNDNTVELKPVIAIEEIDGDCYTKIVTKSIKTLEEAYNNNLPYVTPS